MKPEICSQRTGSDKGSWRKALVTSSWWIGHCLDTTMVRTVRIVVGLTTGLKFSSYLTQGSWLKPRATQDGAQWEAWGWESNIGGTGHCSTNAPIGDTSTTTCRDDGVPQVYGRSTCAYGETPERAWAHPYWDKAGTHHGEAYEVTKMNTEPSGMSHILHMLDVQIGCITTDVEQPLRHASDSAGLSRLAHSL